MKPPTKAIVLAAGLGTRMLPLTRVMPKALVPFRDIPMLTRTLHLLAGWGIRDVLVNLHHKPDQIHQNLLHNCPAGLRLSMSFEPAILGTGGALAHARWFLDDSPVWMVNADVLTDLNPSRLLADYARHQPLAVLWMEATRGPRTVRMRDGVIESFATEKPGITDTYTFCGVHLISPAIKDYLTDGYSSIITAYQRAQKVGLSVRGTCVPDAYWADLGTPQSYLHAHAQAPAALPGPVTVGPATAIPGAARMQRSVVLPGARLLAGANLTDAIVAPGVTVDGHLSGIAIPLSTAPHPKLRRIATQLGWNHARSFLQELPARGSARSFYRLGCGKQRAMAVLYSLQRTENALYEGHTRFLAAAGLPVPKVLASLKSEQIIALQDLGDETLTDYARHRTPASVANMYASALATAAQLHTTATQLARRRTITLCEPFSPALCEWEHDLFITHFLRERLHTRESVIRRLRSDLEKLSQRFLKQAPVLVHRDFQSSNILIRQGQPFLIDYQGMRLGPALYDVASLLCDPYVDISPAQRHTLLLVYAKRAGLPPQRALEDFPIAAVQRLLQAIGAFGRLSQLPGMHHFEKHILTALVTLASILHPIPGLDYLRKNVQNWIHKVQENNP